MKQKIDWMPFNHEELYNKATQTVLYLISAVLTRIGIAGAALVWYQNEFIPKYNKFKEAFGNWKNPAERTPTKSAVLYAAEKEFKTVYRQLYIGYIRKNPLVTDDDLVSAGFPRHSTGRRASAVSLHNTLVGMRTDTSIPATVIIHFYDAQNLERAKPTGVRGGELVWAILDRPPVDWSELTHSEFNTRTPLQLVFRGDQRGKTLYFAMRWENTRGEKGPWNNIESVIIP
jgi:hypothetical protein